MTVINGLRALKKPVRGSVVTIGVFDGVHIGHRKVIAGAVERAKARRLDSVVMTFEPHPLKVLHPLSWIPSLISLEHRIRLIEELGADILVVAKFSKEFSRMSAEKFIKDILVSNLGAREIYVSEGFCFGRGAAADTGMIKDIGRRFGVRVNVIKPVKVGGRTVSSSIIRKLIAEGDIDTAARFLGRPVSVLGTVVRGANLARELGYPTANINPHHEVVPPGGVYAVKVRFRGRALKGVLNIGLRPTFFSPRDREPNIEVHIFSFHKKIYSQDLEVLFVKKIRDEVKFKGRQELVDRIRQDVKLARDILR